MRTESTVTMPMHFTADARRTKDGTIYVTDIKVRGSASMFEYLPQDIQDAALEELAKDARSMFDDLDLMTKVAP